MQYVATGPLAEIKSRSKRSHLTFQPHNADDVADGERLIDRRTPIFTMRKPMTIRTFRSEFDSRFANGRQRPEVWPLAW